MATIAYRPLRAGERTPVLEVFSGLSERSRRLRFLGSKPRLLESDLAHLVNVGCCGREAVAAIHQESGRTVGIARFVRDEGAPEAEIAFEVVDEWQGNGIGARLVREVVALGGARGITEVVAEVLAENAAMRRVLALTFPELLVTSSGPEITFVGRQRDDGWRAVAA